MLSNVVTAGNSLMQPLTWSTAQKAGTCLFFKSLPRELAGSLLTPESHSGTIRPGSVSLTNPWTASCEGNCPHYMSHKHHLAFSMHCSKSHILHVKLHSMECRTAVTEEWGKCQQQTLKATASAGSDVCQQARWQAAEGRLHC